MARRLEEVGSIALVERALSDIRKGKMVVLTDDEDRENEGDLVMAAAKVTPAAINFMATHGRGLICLSLTDDRLRQLNLPLMVHDNTSPFGTAFTVSIEAARGVTTGISAQDRARTILAAVAPGAKPGDLVRPGHVFPLRARAGGVLVRTGQTEGSVDLARLAGLFPAGVICEVMNADGTMARRAELQRFSRRHRLTLLSVADLIRYRLQRDRLVRRIGSTVLERPGQGSWAAQAYASDVDSSVHVALVKGDVTGPKPVLTRMHRACPVETSSAAWPATAAPSSRRPSPPSPRRAGASSSTCGATSPPSKRSPAPTRPRRAPPRPRTGDVCASSAWARKF